MILADFYSYIYISFLAVFTVICIILYSQYPVTRIKSCNRHGNQIPTVALAILMAFFIGFRPISGKFVDMMNYTASFHFIAENNPDFEFNIETENLIFDNLFKFWASNLYDISLFFFFIASIYFFCMMWALIKIYPNDSFYALIVYLGAFSTFSYGTNGIKAGAAASIFLLVFAFYKKPILAALFALVSLGFHHSMTLPIFAFLLAFFVRNPKYFFFGWLACLFLSFVQIEGVTNFLSQFADERGQDYLLAEGDEDWGGKTGFRADFILYSLPPILIGIWAIYRHGVEDRLYQLMLCTYITVNAVWMLCMYVPYNNRIAYLSWFILPVVSIYPFLKLKLKTRQYIQLNYVVAMYLAFTLVMTFVI